MLPLCFVREPRVDTLGKFKAFFPAHLLHRPIRGLEMARVLAHHRRPEILCDRRVAEPSAVGPCHHVARSFPGGSTLLFVRRPHPGAPGRDPPEPLDDTSYLGIGPQAEPVPAYRMVRPR